MSELYEVVEYKDLKDGQDVLAYARRASRWDFDMDGIPRYAIVRSTIDIAALRARIEEMETKNYILQTNRDDVLAINKGLEARIAELELDNRWIPVCEGLPEKAFPVLVAWEDVVVLGYYGNATETWYEDDSQEPINDVTHWMQIPDFPKPPEEE